MIKKPNMALLLSYISIASISAAIITPALPAIGKSYALTHGALEWIISLFLLGYVIGQLVYGPIANRYGRKRSLQSGLMLNVVGVLICIVAVYVPNYPLLLFGRLVTALGAASGLCCTFVIINESLPQDKIKQAMSFSVISFTLGIGAAVTIGGILTQYLRWEDCFWVLLSHGLIMLYCTRFLPETLKHPTKISARDVLLTLGKSIKNKKLVVFSLTIGFVTAFLYTYSAAAPIFARKVLQLMPSVYGYWNLLNEAGMLGGGFLSAYLMRRHKPKSILLAGLLLIIPGLVSLAVLSLTGSTSTIWFFSTTIFINFTTGLIFPTASYYASNALPDKANASSAMSFINMGSAMIAVVILGYLPLPSVMSFTVISIAFYILILALILPYLLSKKIAGKRRSLI